MFFAAVAFIVHKKCFTFKYFCEVFTFVTIVTTVQQNVFHQPLTRGSYSRDSLASMTRGSRLSAMCSGYLPLTVPYIRSLVVVVMLAAST